MVTDDVKGATSYGQSQLMVRGYGLVDSPKAKAVPGKIVNLRAVVAPTPAAAADYYPAIHGYSMLEDPRQE